MNSGKWLTSQNRRFLSNSRGLASPSHLSEFKDAKPSFKAHVSSLSLLPELPLSPTNMRNKDQFSIAPRRKSHYEYRSAIKQALSSSEELLPLIGYPQRYTNYLYYTPMDFDALPRRRVFTRESGLPRPTSIDGIVVNRSPKPKVFGSHLLEVRRSKKRRAVPIFMKPFSIRKSEEQVTDRTADETPHFGPGQSRKKTLPRLDKNSVKYE